MIDDLMTTGLTICERIDRLKEIADIDVVAIVVIANLSNEEAITKGYGPKMLEEKYGAKVYSIITEKDGKHLSVLKKIEKVVGYEKIQLVTISRASAYAEYEPYHFVETEEEFEYAVGLLNAPTSINIAKMTDEEIHEKLQRGYADAEAGNVKEAVEVFEEFRKNH